MTYENEILQQLNRSGFPFQLRVEDIIGETYSSQHQWSVASREHPWIHPETGSNGFIDIVLKHDFVISRLVIECKRMRSEDSRQLRWLFLLPDQEMKQTTIASCLEIEGELTDNRQWWDVRVWDDVRLSPPSFESEFCVLPNDEQRRQPILESLASELLEATEGLAQEEINIEKSQGGNPHLRRFFVPVIVTNAELIACNFRSGDVKVNNGTLDVTKAKLTPVPFIRFRKSLTNRFPDGRFADLAAAQRARERTVLVVNAESIPSFLANWKIEPRDFDFAVQRHIRMMR